MDNLIEDLKLQNENLRKENFRLFKENKRHSGNVIEICAIMKKCERHLPKFRGCAYQANKPCECRTVHVAEHFPEYNSEGIAQ
jgi:hypothetical protein